MTQYIVETFQTPATKVVVENAPGQQIVVETPAADRVVVEFVAGPPGRDADLKYHHQQAMPSASWSINHNMGKFPSVVTLDSSGSQIVGTVSYVDPNNVIVNFAYPFSGEAYLN